MTQENDIVLIYFEKKPLAYARIETITADRKKDWYLVKLLILSIPLQVVHWLLRDVYIDGAEFTMDGKTMRLEQVFSPPEDSTEEIAGAESRHDDAGEEDEPDARVIPFPTPPED